MISKEGKDLAYWERNQLVAHLSKFIILGYKNTLWRIRIGMMIGETLFILKLQAVNVAGIFTIVNCVTSNI